MERVEDSAAAEKSCLGLQGVWRRGVSVTSGKEVILLKYRCNSAPGFNSSSILCPQVPFVVGSVVVPDGAAAAQEGPGLGPSPCTQTHLAGQHRLGNSPQMNALTFTESGPEALFEVFHSESV